MAVLVLLDRPEFLNIPYFAMGHPSAREPSCSRLPLAGLTKRAGRRCAAWVMAQANGVELIKTRDVIPPKTACHAHWLLFRDPLLAEAFLAEWPRYDSRVQAETLRRDREALAAKLALRLARGQFDLGRLPEPDRLPVARRYVALNAELTDLDERLAELTRAAELAVGWAARL